jgi:hypothetical protein
MARGAAALLLTALALAGCGDAPKVASDEYLDRCKTELMRQDRGDDFSEQDLEAICRCTQARLVARGDGDKALDDASLRDGRELFHECAVELLERN